MNNTLTFAVGVAVGAVASYFIFKKKFQADADNQISEVKAKMAELKEVNDALHGAKEKAEANYNKPIDLIAPKEEQAMNTSTVDYNAISNVRKAKLSMKKKENATGIRSISEPEYYSYVNDKKYDERLLIFYQGDGQLIDEESELVIVHPEEFVGPDGVDAMKDSSVEEMYFVDEDKDVVCTVTISEDSYDIPAE